MYIRANVIKIPRKPVRDQVSIHDISTMQMFFSLTNGSKVY